MSFEYLLEKINSAPIDDFPYAHLQINNFLTDEHFREIVSAPEIAVHGVSSDPELFDRLFERGYKIINFPGCITNRDAYISWHRQKSRQKRHNNTACEGFGVTLRLVAPTSPILGELVHFLESEDFQEAIAARFGIDRTITYPDSGIQKYLDGYEISPHPDIRQKALTYMVNVNPGSQSEDADHHTHYLRFRPEYKYVQAYWEGNQSANRCWVPWDWCETVKVQKENNSIVIFSPNDTTMHGVRARYDHLASQRTQLYGNLWYKDLDVQDGPEWEDLVLQRKQRAREKALGLIKAAVPPTVKGFIKEKITADKNVVADRLKK